MPAVTEESRPAQRRRGRYPRQFRKDAAALVIDVGLVDCAEVGAARRPPAPLAVEVPATML